MPPRKAMGHVPPSGNANVPAPPIRFDDTDVPNTYVAKRTSGGKSSTPATRKRRGFTGFMYYFLTRFFALYALVAALFTCSSHPFRFDYSAKDSRAICRSLAHGKSHIVPTVTPLIRSAHERIDPYTGPYIKAVSPYTQAAWKTAKPYYKHAQKQGRVLHKKHLEPLRKKAIKKGRVYVDPHIKTFNTHYKKQVQPQVDNFNKAIKPYQDIYTHDVAPYLSQAYTYSLAAGGTSYAFYVKQVHPHVITSLQQLHSFYVNHADPAMRRAYSLYIRPQVEKLLAKIFERKAHATGSEAISEAKQEVKEAAKESKARSKEQQAEAEKEAIRRRQDPTLAEKASQVTESLLRGKPDELENEIETARLDAELDAELEKVKEQLEAWETGMTKLMAQEYKLLTERVADLRNRRLADLPDHFASLTETYVEDEVAAVLARLERTYKKLAKSDLTVSEQISQANKQHALQKAKLTQSEESLKQQIAKYDEDLTNDEIKAMEASVGEVRRYVREAQKFFRRIMDEAKFERSVEDYEGWDGGLMQRANLLEKDLGELLKGSAPLSGVDDAIDLRKEPKLAKHIADLQSRVKKLYSTANSQVDSYATLGNMQLRGEGALGAISDATDAVGDQARQLAEGAATVMLDAALAARSKLGLAPKQEPGILERVQQSLSGASQSVASAVGATPTAKSAGDYVQSASSMAASAVGYKTRPDSYIEIIGDSVQDAMNAAASTANDISSGASDAYNDAAQKAGNVFEAATTSAGNVYKAASSSVISILPTSIGTEGNGDEAIRNIVGVAQERFGSLSQSASQMAASATAGADSGFAAVTDTARKGMEQGADSLKDIYETVKGSVEDAAAAATFATQEHEDDSLVGKKPSDKDFNTVGKAADALKDRVVHAEL